MENYLKLSLRYAAAALAAFLVVVCVSADISSARMNIFSLSEPSPFICPAPLRHQVDFWKLIFTQYTTKQAVIHDNRYLNIIYSVVDLTEEERNSKKARIGTLSFEISKYREILLKLDKALPEDIENLSSEERRVYDMFRDIGGDNKFSDAAERLRAQIGQRDRFQKALSKSSLYLKEMERIFREEGLPVELTRLPFVESAFDLNAYSWAKAAGIWQFTDYTGKYFLKMNAMVDERIDPMKSTRAAARLLADNYAQLGTWPLAITAYNHGASGMLRAVNSLSTNDISEIVARYRGPLFGFASRNFYTEFLAVLEILKDYRSYFGDVEFLTPEEYEVLHIDRPTKVSKITSACSIEDIRRLNPDLKSPVLTSKLSLPNNYRLKLPPGTKDSLNYNINTETPNEPATDTQPKKTIAASKSDTKKKVDPPSEKAVHIKPDTTLTASAKNTDTKPKSDSPKKPEPAPSETSKPEASKSDKKAKVETIAKSADMPKTEVKQDPDKPKSSKPENTKSETSKPEAPKSDKKAKVEAVARSAEKPKDEPKSEHKHTPDTAKKPEDKPKAVKHHTVITGQTLYSIAKMYHLTVKDLMKVNSISDPEKVKTGIVLQIPRKG
ncbi:MAG: transglycosylase SLT domain-containing protein [Nitrospirae bacterium]|nr:transglycosylase SLT domain-containing protein [Nitrospirota bacterium]